MISHPFPYRLIRSNRKTLAIQVSISGQVIVRAPRTMSDSTIHRFLSQKESWVLEHISRAASVPSQSPAEDHPLSDFRRSYYMESARKIFKRKTAAYARKMDVTYGRITIREQKTRWGSCTSEGNLNFNWRLIFAPEKVLDYVVVHELAHRKEMNHSPAFYAVVASVMPEYKTYEKWLRDNAELCGKILRHENGNHALFVLAELYFTIRSSTLSTSPSVPVFTASSASTKSRTAFSSSSTV